ncbi:hypothetical protein ACFYY3_31005 [Streptomyces sp. NPDC001812]|uniref:Uncharacterized protein n=1 Tax=Streptomyces cathayae TaxID=3031124 RepID=A0ABY8K9J9_9ACTN|nr:hypothetical protein [Streptomyces sp. HUAS 5]WGD44129.1 hypothetical protein PYS65_30565 [Streptomyces sp. HUAS 5]
MTAGEKRPSHRANVTTDSPASSMIGAQVGRGTWKPSFGAASPCHGFASLARGGMIPASANAGFRV